MSSKTSSSRLTVFAFKSFSQSMLRKLPFVSTLGFGRWRDRSRSVGERAPRHITLEDVWNMKVCAHVKSILDAERRKKPSAVLLDNVVVAP